MKVIVDADACPVVNITVALCRQAGVECLLLCDTAHEMHRDGAQTLVFDKGADSVDFALVNRVSSGDIVVTQDYGLASMCLAKQAIVLHQDGWAYTEDNIGALLFQRSESRKYRASGGRIKGPSKRTRQQDKNFEQALSGLLQQTVQG
jgi:uncharacterized protein YaiI (UPF0178 family)